MGKLGHKKPVVAVTIRRIVDGGGWVTHPGFIDVFLEIKDREAQTVRHHLVLGCPQMLGSLLQGHGICLAFSTERIQQAFDVASSSAC